MKPNAAKAFNKALKYKAEGKSQIAISYYKKAIKIDSTFHQAHNNLANLYLDIGASEAAIPHFLSALKLDPKNPLLLNNYGRALMQRYKYDQAVLQFQAAIELDANNSLYYLNLLTANTQLGDMSRAKEAYNSLIAQGFSNLVLDLYVLKVTKHSSKSCLFHEISERISLFINKSMKGSVHPELIFDQTFHPTVGSCLIRELAQFAFSNHQYVFLNALLNDRKILNNCSKRLSTLKARLINRQGGSLDEARALLNDAIEFNPYDDQAYAVLADIAYWDGDKEKLSLALKSLRKLNSPIHPVVECIQYLEQHKFSEGFYLYANQYKTNDHLITPHNHEINFEGETIILWSDQGIGDEVMFSQLIDNTLLENPYSIKLNCEPRLFAAFKRKYGDAIELHDRHHKPYSSNSENEINMLTSQLPSRYIKSIDDFPSKDYFLTPNQQLKTKAKEWMRSLPRQNLNIGIAWKGGAGHLHGRRANVKSCNLSDFKSLFSIEGINWINLQYGDVSADITDLYSKQGITLHHWVKSNPLVDIEHQLALISELDLVVQISNASVHFSGALGIPTLCLVGFPSDFRWFEGHTKGSTPWYPSVKTFFQAKNESWSDLISGRVQDQVTKYLASN